MATFADIVSAGLYEVPADALTITFAPHSAPDAVTQAPAQESVADPQQRRITLQLLSDLAHARCYPFFAVNGVPQAVTAKRFFQRMFAKGDRDFGAYLDFAEVYLAAKQGNLHPLQNLDLMNMALAVAENWPTTWAECSPAYRETDWGQYLHARDMQSDELADLARVARRSVR